MSQARSFEMPGRYPGASPDNSDGEIFHGGQGDILGHRRLEAIRAELSNKRALLEWLPQEDTHLLDLETLQAQILSLEEEFEKLVMEQSRMNELPPAYSTGQEVVPQPGSTHESGLHGFDATPPRQDIMRKRTYSQVDHSPHDLHVENFRRLVGPYYNAPSQFPYMPSGPPMPMSSLSPDGAQSMGVINSDTYLPVVQIAGSSNRQQAPQQAQISNDAELARILQEQEVIDLTGDDDDTYNNALIATEYQRYARDRYARAGQSPFALQMPQDPQFISIPRVKIEQRHSNPMGFGARPAFKNETDVSAHIPQYTGLGLSDNPIILNGDDDDDDDGGFGDYIGPHHALEYPPYMQQFNQALPQVHLPRFPFPIDPTQNFDPDTPYNDMRYQARDEQEDVKRILEHLSDDAENDSSDRLQTPPELSVKLMKHQRIGLTWLVKQEESNNKGGILADDMGLGKTVQAIALILHRKSDNPHLKTTLIVCPVSLMAQWQREIQAKVKAQNSLATYIYHGTQPKRYKNFNALKEFDVVLTSYGTIAGEFKKKQSWIGEKRTRFPPEEFPFLSGESIWYRVILDESQHIKNHRTQSSRACADLRSTYRLCLSGTPMQNNIDDLFGAVRFLRLARYREFRDWNKDFGSRIRLGRGYAADAMQRLQALIGAIMLRRKKDSLIDGEPLLVLPPKTIELIHPIFGPDEQEIYNAVEQRVQLRFNKYIENGSVLRNYTYVLLLLLRLRQVCCHPKMIKDLSINVTKVEKERQITLMQQLDPATIGRLKLDPAVNCPVCQDSSEKMKIISPCGHCFCEECLTNYMNMFAQMVDGDDGNRMRCPICRGPLSQSSLIDWQVFREIYMPEDGDLLQELEGIGNQLDNVLGGQLSSDDSDSDSGSDSDDEGSDLGGFIVPDGEVESEADDDSDEAAALRETRSRYSPVPPARVKQEPGSSRQNGVKKEEDTEVFFPATQNSATSSSSDIKSEQDFPGDIWEEFKFKKEAKEENDGISIQSVKSKSTGAKPRVKKERKDEKASSKGKGKKLASNPPKTKKGRKKKKKEKKEKRVINLGDKRALAVRNKKARKKYFRELARDWHSSAKIDKVRAILKEIRENDPSEKTIIFSSFTSFLDLLSIPLDRDDKFNFERYDGSMSARDRNDAVLNFTEDPMVTVMLVSLKAGNSGLNLTVASHVIIIDPWWNPYVEEQAIDRAHRIGQTRPVFVHRLIIENTVEDRILTLQEQKREMISAAMDEEAIKGLNRLSVRDLMYLFTGSR
ncbi:hypothetical protein TWF730_002171 [Orbilia blumenaviensis]|uniref:Uncharacterized protein n=1 Tax=Orbilia blumenaviensis TaxID=1796055 RepID=A0AAV9UID0_9PEZI